MIKSITDVTTNEKFIENLKDKSISKIKENFEGEEDSNNNTHNYLLFDDKNIIRLFRDMTIKENDLVNRKFS